LNLRKKSILLLSTMVLGSTILISLLSGLLLVDKTYEIENDLLTKEIENTVKLINYDISNLDSTVADWAFWDDTYYYASEKNYNYIEDNLVDETFTSLDINFFVILEDNGKIMYKKAYDLIEEKEIEFPQDLENSLSSSEIFVLKEKENIASGILTTENNIVFLASRPILRSDSSGPIAGTLIMGQFVDSRKVNIFSEISSTPIQVYKINSPEIGPVIKEANPKFLEGKTIHSKIINDSKILGYYVLKDLHGDPGLILEVELSRDIYLESKKLGFYLLMATLGFSIFAGIIFIFAFEKGILSKIFSLEKDVKRISSAKDFSSRLKVYGDDEISSLALNINEMIESIDASSAILKESEKRYRTLFEESRDAVWATSIDGEILDANEASAKLLDIPLYELIGSNILDLYNLPEERIEFQKKVAEFGSVKEYPLVFKNRMGEKIHCLVSFSAWRDENGKIIGYRGIVHDITSRKIYEKQLVELNEALRILNKILRHDILNDLTIVLTAIDLMSGGDERLKIKASKAINKSITLIDRMRELEQAVTSGGQMKKYNLQEVINEIIKNYANIEFSISGDCNVVADGALNSVIDNLVRNAIVHGKTDKIDFKIENEEKSCILKVIDYGNGIPENFKKNIFEEGASFGENKGSGLGLFIVKKVIERYGGEIEIQDNKPRGTVFIVKFNNLIDKS